MKWMILKIMTQHNSQYSYADGNAYLWSSAVPTHDGSVHTMHLLFLCQYCSL